MYNYSTVNGLKRHNTMEDDYAEDFDLQYDFDEDNNHLLEQQELMDFAQDGCFENMEPMEDGFWG